MATVAPPWYASLRARRPRRTAIKNRGADDELIALAGERAVLVGEYAEAVACRARTETKLVILERVTAELEAHAADAGMQCLRVTAYRAKLIARLTDESIAASLSGDFTTSRRTMAHLDKVTDRQLVLGERVASGMESLRKAAFVRADHESQLEVADKTKLRCAETLNRLGTWALRTK